MARMRTRQGRRGRPAMVVGNASLSLLFLLVGCFINSPNLFDDMHPVEQKFLPKEIKLDFSVKSSLTTPLSDSITRFILCDGL